LPCQQAGQFSENAEKNDRRCLALPIGKGAPEKKETLVIQGFLRMLKATGEFVPPNEGFAGLGGP
jgi:hypothetical protein